ncbi:MAG: glycosyltransferase family 4 protein [Thermoanaerobaculia bacterium]
MKILVAQDALHSEGGVESYLAAVVPALRARGHSIAMLFVRRGRRTPLSDQLDGPCVGVDLGDPDDAVAQLTAWRPDVCFSNNMAPLEIERRLLDRWPVVKFMHAYFGTCISALKMHEFPSRVACTRTLGAGCLALYGPRHCGELRPSALVNGYRWARLQQQLLSRYQTIVIASEHMADEYARHGVSRDRLAMLPLFPSLPVATIGDAPRDSVLFLGRMTTLKGGDILVRAVGRAASDLGRPIRLVMAGDGPQRVDWQRLASRERVGAEFPGWLDTTARLSALAQASVLAVPSLWPEPFGLVGLEAAARGVPAVAFDTGGMRQWLHHDVSGLLAAPAGGFHAIASALARVLDDPPLRSRLSRGAIAAATAMSLDAHTDALDRVLMNAITPSIGWRSEATAHS